MENKVIVKGLVKNFGNLEVLKGMDVEVKDGEVVCLIGPSGSGKVLFKMSEPAGIHYRRTGYHRWI